MGPINSQKDQANHHVEKKDGYMLLCMNEDRIPTWLMATGKAYLLQAPRPLSP